VLIGREFDRNTLIMLLSIMVGVVIITYFVADIQARTDVTETLTIEHVEEIATITNNNENFTNNFMKSSVLLDSAREDRAAGNYNFDLAFLWYKSALAEKNETNMDLYKSRTLTNCDNAMYNYSISSKNFEEASKNFNNTKTFVSYEKYEEILNIYVDLCESGIKLTLLRYNASQCLKELTEYIIMDTQNGTVVYSRNVTELLGLLEGTLEEYAEELEIFEELKKEIDEYEFFDENR